MGVAHITDRKAEQTEKTEVRAASEATLSESVCFCSSHILSLHLSKIQIPPWLV